MSEKVNFRGKNKNFKGQLIMVKEAIHQGVQNFKQLALPIDKVSNYIK